MRTVILFLFIAMLASPLLVSQEPGQERVESDPARYIGLDLSSSYEMLGVPDRVYPVRGQSNAHDDVVFYYSDHVYLYWYDNRVWQVRCDARFDGEVAGIRIGMDESETGDVLGTSMLDDGPSRYYDLPDRGYPVRIRVDFKDGAVHDLYVYRADF